MQIVHVVLTKRFAGSERYAIELANAQSREHDVSLILQRAATDERPDALIQHVDARVKVLLVGGWDVRSQVRVHVKHLQPDVVHAHLSRACKSLRRLHGSWLRVATLHICYKPQQHAHMDALVAIAPWQLAGVSRRLRDHTVQIDNWTAPKAVDASARQKLRRTHGIADDALVIGALGRVEPSKGFDLLLRAFDKLRRRSGQEIYLVVVGDGPQLMRLRKRAGSHVVLPGFSANPQDWLAAFDCFVSASRMEPFGLVFLEAMQAGLPILATRTQGALHLAPVMRPTLVAADEETALAAALQRWVDQPPARQTYDLREFRIHRKLPKFNAFYARERLKLASRAAFAGV